MYAITGITGQVGSAVANSLLAMNRQVRAVVRNPGGHGWRCPRHLMDTNEIVVHREQRDRMRVVLNLP